MTDRDPLELFTLNEVSAITKRSRRGLYYDIEAGRLNVYHHGRSVKVPRFELERYLAEVVGVTLPPALQAASTPQT